MSESKPKKRVSKKAAAESVPVAESASAPQPKKSSKKAEEKKAEEKNVEEAPQQQQEEKKVVRRKITKERVWDDVVEVKSVIDELHSEKAAKGKGDKTIGIRKLTQLKNKYDTLYKHVSRLYKKEPKRTTNEKSGLNKPTKASDALLDFMGLKQGTLVRRTDVTSVLCDYVTKQGLKNPVQKREILPDDTLAKLLHYNKDEHGPLTFCSMQKLVQVNFPKDEEVKA